MSDINTWFTQNFKNVTETALKSYEHFVESDYIEDDAYPVDALIVYELMYQRFEHNDFAEDSDFADGDAGTFGYEDGKQLLKAVAEHFNDRTYQIYAIESDFLNQLKAQIYDQTGFELDNLMTNATTPYDYDSETANQTYIALPKLEDKGELVIKRTLNESFFGGKPNTETAFNKWIKF